MNIYLVRFFSNLAPAGFYPFLAVWLLNSEVLSAFKISVIISTGILMSRMGSILFSNYVNNHNKKNCIITSSLLLIGVIAGIAESKALEIDNLIIWIILAILWGILIAIITLSVLVFVANTTSGLEQKRGFSYVNVAINLSGGLGPVMASMLLAYHPDSLPVMPIIALLITILFAVFVPSDFKEKPREKKSIHIRKITVNWPFSTLLILNFLTFVSYSQFYNIFPAYADNFIDKTTIGALFFMSSIVVSITQVPFNSMLNKTAAYKVIFFANILAFVGTTSLITIENNMLPQCLLAVVFISLAQVLYTPIYQAMATQMFHGSSTYALALVTLMWGMGEGSAVILGFYLIEHNIGYYSYIIGGSSALLAAILVLITRKSMNYIANK